MVFLPGGPDDEAHSMANDVLRMGWSRIARFAYDWGRCRAFLRRREMVRLALLGLDQLTDHVDIPLWVIDLDSFRRWMDSDDFPEEGRINYIKGEVWVDMSK